MRMMVILGRYARLAASVLRRLAGSVLWPAAVAVPFGREDRHRGRVDPLVLPAQLGAQYTLGDEADLVVDVPRPRVEGIDLQGDPVQGQLLEAISDDQPDGFRAEPAVPSAGSEHGAETAAAAALVPAVEDNFADAVPAGLVHDGQVEAIWLLIPGAVPVPEPGLGCLVPLGRVLRAVQAARELERFQILKHLAERSRVLVYAERTQHFPLAGQRRIGSEVGSGLIDHDASVPIGRRDGKRISPPVCAEARPSGEAEPPSMRRAASAALLMR